MIVQNCFSWINFNIVLLFQFKFFYKWSFEVLNFKESVSIKVFVQEKKTTKPLNKMRAGWGWEGGRGVAGWHVQGTGTLHLVADKFGNPSFCMQDWNKGKFV